MEDLCGICKGRVQAMAVVNRVVPMYCVICRNRNEEEVKVLVDAERSLPRNEDVAQ